MNRAASSSAVPFLLPKAAEASKHGRRQEHPEITWIHVPRIEPGDYHAFSRSSATYWDRQYKRWVCAVQFDILDGVLIETVAGLTWYLNMGNREKPHAGRRGNYWTAWVKANDGSPKRHDRLSPRVFEHRYAVVQVGDTSKNFRQELTDEQNCYSVVRSVVEWEEIGALR